MASPSLPSQWVILLPHVTGPIILLQNDHCEIQESQAWMDIADQMDVFDNVLPKLSIQLTSLSLVWTGLCGICLYKRISSPNRSEDPYILWRTL